MSLQFALRTEAGADLIRECGLFVEAGPNLDNPILNDLHDRVTSAHAPADFRPGTFPGSSLKNIRLHIACTEKEIRDRSVQQIIAYVRNAHNRFSNLRVIVMHAAPKRFPFPPVRPCTEDVFTLRPDTAQWEHLVSSVCQVTKACAELGLLLAVENNWAYWDGIDPERPVSDIREDEFLEYFCSSPEEWYCLCRDVSESNMGCCLDTSHAVPYCHRFEKEAERRREIAHFLSEPQHIIHFHWNDSDIITPRGRDDLHLPVGEGNLGVEIHSLIKERALELDHPVTLEHFRDRDTLKKEIRYITDLCTGI